MLGIICEYRPDLDTVLYKVGTQGQLIKLGESTCMLGEECGPHGLREIIKLPANGYEPGDYRLDVTFLNVIGTTAGSARFFYEIFSGPLSTSPRAKVLNQSPVANAGPVDQLSSTTTVTLDGSGSTDPDSAVVPSHAATDINFYAWSWDNGAGESGYFGSASPVHTIDLADGVYNVTLTVVDRLGHSDTSTVTLTVDTDGPANLPPTATPDSVAATEDTQIAITLAGSDPEGSALSYGVLTQPSNGTLSGLAPDLLYTPDQDYNGPDSFTFNVNDGSQDSAAATIDITVAAINDEPVVTITVPSGDITVTEGDQVDFTGTAVDVELGDVAASIVWASSLHGGLGSGANLSTSALVVGTHTITAAVADGNRLGTDSLLVTVEQAAVNEPPVANAGPNQEVRATSKGKSGGANVTLNAGASSDDVGIVSYVWSWSNGNLETTDSSETAFFTEGVHDVTLTVMDGGDLTSTDTVCIDVYNKNPSGSCAASGGNNAPLADDQSVSTTENTPLSITLTASDPDGDPLTFDVTSFPGFGSLTGTAPNLTYTPGSDLVGTDSFSFVANDGDADSNTGTISITINPEGGSGVTLATAGYKVNGVHHADLNWSGAASTNVEIYRDGTLVATTVNDGDHTENIGAKGGSSYAYQVCETGGGACSGIATIAF